MIFYDTFLQVNIIIVHAAVTYRNFSLDSAIYITPRTIFYLTIKKTVTHFNEFLNLVL